jgi:hypothetical protein
MHGKGDTTSIASGLSELDHLEGRVWLGSGLWFDTKGPKRPRIAITTDRCDDVPRQGADRNGPWEVFAGTGNQFTPRLVLGWVAGQDRPTAALDGDHTLTVRRYGKAVWLMEIRCDSNQVACERQSKVGDENPDGGHGRRNRLAGSSRRHVNWPRARDREPSPRP